MKTIQRVRARLREAYSGRPAIMVGPALAGGTPAVRHLLDLGATEVLVISTAAVAGAARSAGARAVEVALPAAARRWDCLMAEPPPRVADAVEAVDPERTARVLVAPWCSAERLGDRPAFGPRRAAWRAIEDPFAVAELWRDAGVPAGPCTVVEVTDAPPAAADLDSGHGTVWHAGGAYWVPDVEDATTVADLLAGRHERVRVTPFLYGRPCGVHGIVLPDGTVALRPVEHVVAHDAGGRRLRRVGAGTTWDQPAAAGDELRDIARRVGAVLARRAGHRSAFAVGGVLTSVGFRPTGVTLGWDPTAAYLEAALPELPYLLLQHALAAGVSPGVSAADLEELLLTAGEQRRHARLDLPLGRRPGVTQDQPLIRGAAGWRAATGSDEVHATLAVVPALHGEGAGGTTPGGTTPCGTTPGDGGGRDGGGNRAGAGGDGGGNRDGSGGDEETGSDDGAWALRIELDAGRLGRASMANRAGELLRWLSETHHVAAGEPVPAQDPPPHPTIRRSLSLSAPLRRMPHRMLREMLRALPADTPPDGPRGPVARLEARIAALLGKPAALFFPSGTMAQQVALRVHAERTGRRTFAAHPQTHLDVWEERGYAVVHGLRLQPVGDRYALMGTAELAAVGEPLAAVLWELPQRDIGGQLPSWPTLRDQVRWARERGAAAHLDGARLWEAQTFYRRPFAEIAALFDTVYVSLYKSLEGVRGAVLAGDTATIAAAQVWRQRLGGGIQDAWPLAAAALVGLDELLPRMPAFRDHAIAIAAAINADGTARTVPDPPQTPLFHVHLPASRPAVERAGAELLAEHGVQLFGRLRAGPTPATCSFEVTVGENAMPFTPEEVVGHIRDLMLRAHSAPRRR